MKKFIQLTFVLLVLISASFVTNAQNANPQNAISAEKRRLISELVTVTKMDKNLSEITDALLKSMELTYPITYKRALESNPNLTPKERDRLAATMKESFERISKKFRERLPAAVNYPEYIEQSVYPLYDKFFNEKELGDLVAFYKTETGQKVIDTMPQLYAESARLSQELLLPKLLKLMDEILQEEMNKLGKPSRLAGE